jgi:hypothetical protein
MELDRKWGNDWYMYLHLITAGENATTSAEVH